MYNNSDIGACSVDDVVVDRPHDVLIESDIERRVENFHVLPASHEVPVHEDQGQVELDRTVLTAQLLERLHLLFKFRES